MLVRAQRFAVTSRDGISVNERFHRATDYFVFEASDESLRFVERRPRPGPEQRVFRDFDSLASLLHDCSAVISLMFNRRERDGLIGKGFALHEGRGAIEQVIREFLSQTPGTGCTDDGSSASNVKD